MFTLQRMAEIKGCGRAYSIIAYWLFLTFMSWIMPESSILIVCFKTWLLYTGLGNIVQEDFVKLCDMCVSVGGGGGVARPHSKFYFG